MELKRVLFLCCVVFSRAVSKLTDENYDVVTIDRTVFPGNAKFPDDIEIHFNYYGSDVHLKLTRDDVTSSMLSESVFMGSKILPSDVYSDDNSGHFAAYTSDNEDTIVVQREHDSADPKFFGRYTANDRRYVINSLDGSHVLHRVRREASIDHKAAYVDIEFEGEQTSRSKRAVTIDGEVTDVVEVFMFADFSLFTHFKNNVMAAGKTNKEIKDYMKAFLQAVTTEVNIIYEYMSVYGNVTLRVYFQQYQIITKSSQEPWITNTPSSVVESVKTLTEFQTYYQKLVDSFAFPDADHVMGVTTYSLEGGAKVLYRDTMCQSARSISYVDFNSYPYSVAQGIALAFNVSIDGTGNACSSASKYVMSDDYSPGVSNSALQGNRWMFSTCSISEFKTALALNLTCLQTEDSLTDYNAFIDSPSLSDLYDRDAQCNIQLGNNSTFCAITPPETLDCFSDNQGCLNGSECVPSYFAEDTICDTGPGPNARCVFGSCLPNVTTTSSTTSTSTTSSTTSTTSSTTSTTSSTTSTTASTTTTASGKKGTTPGSTLTTTSIESTTSSPDGCVVQTGFVEFDLPGCGCCGGCGCDETCGDNCPDGLGRAGYTQGANCTKDSDCCGAKVRITTLFVPDGCDAEYIPGPRTIVMEKKGWENTDLDVTAEVYQKENLDWQVELVPVL